MGKTNIGWTGKGGRSWPITTGCAHTSEGCGQPLGPGFCYAAAMTSGRLSENPRYAGLAVDGKFTGEVRFHEDRLMEPFTVRDSAMWFVCSMSDLFYDRVPWEFIAKAWAVMALNPRHVFQVLTKRDARLEELLNEPEFAVRVEVEARKIAHDLKRGGRRRRLDPEITWPIRNIWGGVSVENQAMADRRVPRLMRTPLALRWLSCEPLLGSVRLAPEWLAPAAIPCWAPGYTPDRKDLAALAAIIRAAAKHLARPGEPEPAFIDWVVAGGQSGPRHRVMELEWLSSLHEQCATAGVPFFVKQDSGPRPGQQGRIPDELWRVKQWPYELDEVAERHGLASLTFR